MHLRRCFYSRSGFLRCVVVVSLRCVVVVSSRCHFVFFSLSVCCDAIFFCFWTVKKAYSESVLNTVKIGIHALLLCKSRYTQIRLDMVRTLLFYKNTLISNVKKTRQYFYFGEKIIECFVVRSGSIFIFFSKRRN